MLKKIELPLQKKYTVDISKLSSFRYKGIDWLVTNDFDLIHEIMHNIKDMNDNLIFLKRVKDNNKRGAYIADIGLHTNAGYFYKLTSPYFKDTNNQYDEESDSLIEYLLNMGFYGVVGYIKSIPDKRSEFIYFNQNSEKLQELRSIKYEDYLKNVWPILKELNPSLKDKSMYVIDNFDDFNLMGIILPPMEDY